MSLINLYMSRGGILGNSACYSGVSSSGCIEEGTAVWKNFLLNPFCTSKATYSSFMRAAFSGDTGLYLLGVNVWSYWNFNSRYD